MGNEEPTAKIECSHTRIADIESLVPNPKNPNTHPQRQIELLAKIILHQGWRSPIVVSKRSGFIVKGHGRLEAARHAGLQTVPVDDQEYENEAAEWADLIADNRLSELSEVDELRLGAIFQEVNFSDFDMELTGFEESEIDGFKGDEPETIDDTDEAGPMVSEAEVLQQKWGVKPGQIWELGSHRIICGDSSSKEIVASLMNGAQADMVLSDPPYGVAYVGKTKDALKIENDALSEEDLADLVKDAFDQAQEISRPGAYWYATVPAGPLHILFADDWKRRGILRQILVWNKDSMVLGRSEYHYKHEPILFGWVEGKRHKNQDRTRTSVWDCPRPKSSQEHPTMKPVALWERAIKDGSRKGDLVYEPFSGSGTSIIACEQLGRSCRAVEIDPKFVAVAIHRWHELTGKDPTIIKHP